MSSKMPYGVQDILTGWEAGLTAHIEDNKLGPWSDVLLCLLLGGSLTIHRWEQGNFAFITLPDVDQIYQTYWPTDKEMPEPTEADLWQLLCPLLSTGRQWTGYLLDQMYQRYQSREIEWYYAEGGVKHVRISGWELIAGYPHISPCQAIARHLLTTLQDERRKERGSQTIDTISGPVEDIIDPRD